MLYDKVNSFEYGELLDVGNEDVKGGIKYVCNTEKVLLSNGNYEPLDYAGMKKAPYTRADCYLMLQSRNGYTRIDCHLMLQFYDDA